MPVDGARNWSSGWLPPVYQGTAIRSEGLPVLHLQPKTARTSEIDAGRMELLRKLNARHQELRPGELELDARIASFELAARMQLSATDALDLNQETAATQQLSGLDNDKTRSYGKRCRMARRLVERGVRFVQIFMAGQPWDTHSNNVSGIRSCCEQTDLPIGGLLTDLKQRGLLDSTLIQWGGEFGRTPGAEQREGNNTPGIGGRDHRPYGFSVWLTGGGIRGGHELLSRKLWRSLFRKGFQTFLCVRQFKASQVGFCVGSVCHFGLGTFIKVDETFRFPQSDGGHLQHLLRKLTTAFQQGAAGDDFADESPIQSSCRCDRFPHQTHFQGS